MQDALRTRLAANLSIKYAPLVDLDPVVAYVDQEVRRIHPTLHIQPLIAAGVLPDGVTISVFYEMTIRAFDELVKDSSGKRSTVDSIIESLVHDTKLQAAKDTDIQNKDSECVTSLQQIAVAVIGCLTSIFSWYRSQMPNHCAMRAGPFSEAKNQHLENCSRSSGAFIRRFGVLPTPFKDNPWPKNLLYLSLLNFHSLVHIGLLHVEWVSNLSQHLELRLESRTLCLYKYPSLCVLAMAPGDYEKFSTKIMQEDTDSISCSVHKEVLISLRFILSQTRKSRKLAQKLALSTLKLDDRDNTFDLLLDGKLDSILYSSAGSGSIKSSTNKQGTRMRYDTLAPWSDLKLFGSRMLQLQRYNNAQRPTQTRKMIRDKRDPVRWYTLWAVLLVGGLSIIVGIMQLALSCAQLAYAVDDAQNKAKK